MADYGLTPQGPNIKRLDVILEEMHSGLSEKWGVNTRQNPESLLNHLLTNVADAIADLWEFGEAVYFSQYPATAEGRSLDNAAQYGGSTREAAAKSYYPIHCTGKDGTKLAAGTRISSATNPTTYLSITDAREISRTSFNRACIKIASLGTESVYTVAINGAVFSYSPTEADTLTVLKGIAAAITDEKFTASVDETNEFLNIAANDIASNNVLILSENLTTETVTSIITFGTEESGDILIPDGVITNIVNADAGLLSVENLCGYIAGRDEETDVEFRQSYADKIFNRSSNMLESIRSAILLNVQGVRSVAPYENAHAPMVCGRNLSGREGCDPERPKVTSSDRLTASRSWWTAATRRRLRSRSSPTKRAASTRSARLWLSCPVSTTRRLPFASTGPRRFTHGSGWASRSTAPRLCRRTTLTC